jgi:catalase
MENYRNKPTTTDAGIPVSSDEYSLTVGSDGPILLQDHYLIEQMADFNREQIPVNRPKSTVHNYGKDGTIRVKNVSDPVYAPNSKGGPQADGKRYPQVEVWKVSGEFIRTAASCAKRMTTLVRSAL